MKQVLRAISVFVRDLHVRHVRRRAPHNEFLQGLGGGKTMNKYETSMFPESTQDSFGDV